MPVDEPLGYKTAGEAGAAVRDDRLARLRLQIRDFLGRVAACDIGLRPTFTAGLRRDGLAGPRVGAGIPDALDAQGGNVWTAYISMACRVVCGSKMGVVRCYPKRTITLRFSVGAPRGQSQMPAILGDMEIRITPTRTMPNARESTLR